MVGNGRNISTGDGVVDYGVVDFYWGPCGRVCR